MALATIKALLLYRSFYSVILRRNLAGCIRLLPDISGKFHGLQGAHYLAYISTFFTDYALLSIKQAGRGAERRVRRGERGSGRAANNRDGRALPRLLRFINGRPPFLITPSVRQEGGLINPLSAGGGHCH